MSEEAKPKNIYQKLLEIQKKVVGLGKDSSGDNGKFQYVSGSKILEVVKPLMNSLGIILKQEILSLDNTRMDYTLASGKGKTEVLTKATFKFTWVDCETGERDENLFAANGQNGFDKGLGSAATYAERYFLLKFFHIATDEDDVDALPPKEGEEGKGKKEKQPEPPKEPLVPEMTDEQRQILAKHSELTNIFTKEQVDAIKKYISKGQAFDVAQQFIDKNEKLINSKLQPTQ